MFRKLQKYKGSCASKVLEVGSRFLETGQVQQRLIDVSREVLPDVKNYRLDNLLKAGVNLEQINTKVVDK
nr:hypothetical protein RTDJWYLK_RTDJWYLK_CDS_0008 [Microvirus sp.]